MIWAIILAAGESRRMSRPKLLLPFDDRTIIEEVVANVLSSRADGALVVLGANRREIEAKIRHFEARTVTNPKYQEGMFSSVRRGLRALPASARAALFVLADQPEVPTSVINLLIDAYLRKKKGIVVPVFRKRRGHPLLVDLKYRSEIEALSPEIGLRALIRNHPEDVLEVKVSTSAVLRDIDDPKDYGRALKKNRLKERPLPDSF